MFDQSIPIYETEREREKKTFFSGVREEEEEKNIDFGPMSSSTDDADKRQHECCGVEKEKKKEIS